MKKLVNISLVAALLAVSLNLAAQKVQKNKTVSASTERAPQHVSAYLGRSSMSDGLIPKRTFDSLLKQGLTAKDSLGNLYKVSGFTFGYGERNLYEDSIGNMMVLTDYLTEYCPGDTISLAMSRNIFYKTKPGDTAYFDNIKVAVPGKQLVARSMRFVLTK